MTEYSSLAEFLSDGTEPLLSVRGYEVYDITFNGVTSYPVLDMNNAEIVDSASSLSDAVEKIIFIVCLNLVKEGLSPHG